jgi:hypothetical protein
VEEFDVERTLKFKPASGNRIMTAVKKIAKLPITEKHDRGGKISFTLGQNSVSPAADVEIVHPAGKEFESEAIYDTVTIRYHEWPGLKHLVIINENSVVRAIENFRDEFKKELI